MPAFEVNCDVSQAEIKAFTDAIARYQTDTKRDICGAIRSATIDLVKSLRARTRNAPKIVPREDVRFGESDPKYITGTKGKTKGVEFRRVVVSRWHSGARKNIVHWLPVEYRFRTRMGMRHGNYQGIVSKSEASAQMLRNARQTFGRIRQWGLAKKSWGWFMQSLFGRSVQDENPKAKLKPGVVEKEIVERDGEISITIVNRLDYIRKALQPGALSDSLRAAANTINKKIQSGFRSRRFTA